MTRVGIASHGKERGRQLDRVNAFSDGVFSIAATLLVLSIHVPTVSGDDLGKALQDLAGPLTSYFLSFAVIGMFWLRHHQLLGRVRFSDNRFAVLNLVFLAFIALLPGPTELLGRYNEETVGVVVYAVNIIVLAVLLRMLFDDADRRGLTDVDPTDRLGRLRGNAVIAVFAVSIPIAFVAPVAATYVWILAAIIPRLLIRGRGREHDG